MKANNTWWDITEKLPGVRQEPPTCSGNVPVVSILIKDVSHFMEFPMANYLSEKLQNDVDPVTLTESTHHTDKTTATEVSTNFSLDDSQNADFLISPSQCNNSNVTPEAIPAASSQESLWNNVNDNLTAAMYWYSYGFSPIPIGPGSKITAVKWDKWLDSLGPNKIIRHWKAHPDHEVGFIVGYYMIVLDADGPESVSALVKIEARFKLVPLLVVKTSKGQHHYFLLASNTIAKSDSHDSEKYPDRLDIKTGRALVVLPPSTGKFLIKHTTRSKELLSEASQEFIDAINEHNGRPPRVRPAAVSARVPVIQDIEKLQILERLLECIDPDIGYDDWLRAGMAVFYETAGSCDGMELYNSWSSKGGKYEGLPEIEKKWRTFSLEHPRPVRMGTLVMMAQNAGADTDAIVHGEFEVCAIEEASSDDNNP
jgi:uncharacterized protein YeaO (DUF488 family)